MAVKHNTASDVTFSGTGATAWDADHTIDPGTITTTELGGDITTAGKALLDDADAAAQRTTLGLGIGTDVLAYDAGVQQIADLADPNADRILFWDDSASAYKFLTVGTNLSITDTTLDASGGGGASLDAITAAAADQSGIANGDWNIRWNWQKTTNSEVAFELGETAASTNGTSTSGVPNQVLLKLSTRASSTMSPLSVYSRATHVFSVSPSSAQILAAAGSASAPVYSFAGDPNTGFVNGGVDRIDTVLGGSNRIMHTTSANNVIHAYSGTTADNGSAFGNYGYMELGYDGTTLAGLSLCHGSAGTTPVSARFRKSRGTAGSPSVITTGDDLLEISAFGYVGGSNTYQEAGGIKVTSRGAISDSATGVGGITRIMSAATGAESVDVANFRAATTTGGGWMVMDEADADPTTTELDSLDSLAFYNKNNKLVFAYNNAGTITYISIPLDGSSTAWTHSTAAP